MSKTVAVVECRGLNRFSFNHSKAAIFLLEDDMQKDQRGKNQRGSKNPGWKGGKIEKTCIVCKKIYRVYPSESKKIKTCSSKCSSKHRASIQMGENNSCWRGDNAKYHALHSRVRQEKGSPVYCEVCKTMSKNKKYEWASLTGKYENINDYKRMCRSCHKKYDAKQRRKK
jgi:hypothetical protein